MFLFSCCCPSKKKEIKRGYGSATKLQHGISQTPSSYFFGEGQAIFSHRNVSEIAEIFVEIEASAFYESEDNPVLWELMDLKALLDSHMFAGIKVTTLRELSVTFAADFQRVDTKSQHFAIHNYVQDGFLVPVSQSIDLMKNEIKSLNKNHQTVKSEYQIKFARCEGKYYQFEEKEKKKVKYALSENSCT
eukprot:c17645_g1_i1.p1 GENE.c17645_g1_i1~~c17645_g1_i1.p1  ORF type:complete len:190 (+),score=75.43 c17645_g1_i1:24-593(+)